MERIIKNAEVWVVISAVCVLSMVGCRDATRKNCLNAPFVPPEEKVLLVVGQDVATFDAYVLAIGRVPAGWMGYTSIQKMDGLYQPQDHGSGVQFAHDLAQRYPELVIQLGVYLVDALDAIPKGAYDSNLDTLARWLRAVQRPVYLRIGYEFDLPHNRYVPEAYVAAYRYIVTYLRSSNVTNVAYVWHSYGGAVRSDRMRWYPGDAYVDWVGVSIFDVPNQYTREVAILSQQLKKPLMIAEATPRAMTVRQGHKVWRRWFEPFFEFVHKYNVKAICYIAAHWDGQPMWSGQGWGDARVHAYDEIRTLWMQEIAGETYVHAYEDSGVLCSNGVR